MNLYAVIGILLSLAYVGNTEDVVDTIKDIAKKSEQVIECAELTASCEACVKNTKCLWCSSSVVNCIPYPVDQVIPHKDICDLGDARWGVCWVNYKILLITMGCVAGLILFSVVGCVCCCCCGCRKKSARARNQLEEERFERERQDRTMKHAERRGERQTRMEEIRRKYGLMHGMASPREQGLVKDAEPVYQRFENEA